MSRRNFEAAEIHSIGDRRDGDQVIRDWLFVSKGPGRSGIAGTGATDSLATGRRLPQTDTDRCLDRPAPWSDEDLLMQFGLALAAWEARRSLYQR